MSMIFTIFKKEFFGFAKSPIFFVVLFLVSAMMSYLFSVTLFTFLQGLQASQFQMSGSQQANIHYGVFLRHLSTLNLLFIFIVPAFTMRLLSEERKMRTMDLLLTSPISSAQIIVGKYLSALAAVLVITLVALIYPVSTLVLAPIQWGPLAVATLGIFLVGAVYAAMDLFCSAITQSQFLAYIMAVIFNVFIWFIGMGTEVVDTATARAVFEHISLNIHLVSLVEGTVRSSTLIYFGSVIFVFCFLSERMIEASRWR